MKLIVIYPILYQSHQYNVGEELPTNDEEMINAWTQAGTAAWIDETETSVNATPVTAQAGLAGTSPVSETDDNLVGRVPKTESRRRR